MVIVLVFGVVHPFVRHSVRPSVCYPCPPRAFILISFGVISFLYIRLMYAASLHERITLQFKFGFRKKQLEALVLELPNA